MDRPFYKPTPTDLNWAREMLALISEGGILAYPKTGLIYEISHERKTITLVNEEKLLNFESFVVHQQSRIVFEEIGYTMIPPEWVV